MGYKAKGAVEWAWDQGSAMASSQKMPKEIYGAVDVAHGAIQHAWKDDGKLIPELYGIKREMQTVY
jgi:hypothetical protein